MKKGLLILLCFPLIGFGQCGEEVTDKEIEQSLIGSTIKIKIGSDDHPSTRELLANGKFLTYFGDQADVSKGNRRPQNPVINTSGKVVNDWRNWKF